MDNKFLDLITRRAMKLAEQGGRKDLVFGEVFAALSFCHNAVVKLDLVKLYNSRNSEFSHDVFGIIDNIDWVNKSLKNHFDPHLSWENQHQNS